MCFLHHNKRNLQSVLDSFVTKIKDVSHTVAEGASKVQPRSLTRTHGTLAQPSLHLQMRLLFMLCHASGREFGCGRRQERRRISRRHGLEGC